MALNAFTSDASTSASLIALSHQAEPLSPKRGELGFSEEAHGQAADEERARSATAAAMDLPARHPADRDAPPPLPDQVARGISPIPSPPTTNASSPDTPSNASSKKSLRIPPFLNPKTLPSFGGVRLVTLLLLTAQTLILGATVAAWAMSASRLAHSGFQSNSPEVAVTLHIMFGIALLGQSILMFRRIFVLRAERYAYLHPDEILPTSRRPSSSSVTNVAPWNRPPLPTYAASLRASGCGTGDVEDNIIAVPPPPAYGHTRGSKLILSGYLRESLRAQRPPSISSQTSRKSDRPLSQDEPCDRVTRLEQTMARLEESRRGSDDTAPS